MNMEWWYWIIAGLCLIGMELIVPTFTVVWFGFGALSVGILSYLLEGIPFAGQVTLWCSASICFIAMWRRYMNPK
jgi:membrane protein implicated in regulation of membrane protease activity